MLDCQSPMPWQVRMSLCTARICPNFKHDEAGDFLSVSSCQRGRHCTAHNAHRAKGDRCLTVPLMSLELGLTGVYVLGFSGLQCSTALPVRLRQVRNSGNGSSRHKQQTTSWPSPLQVRLPYLQPSHVRRIRVPHVISESGSAKHL